MGVSRLRRPCSSRSRAKNCFPPSLAVALFAQGVESHEIGMFRISQQNFLQVHRVDTWRGGAASEGSYLEGVVIEGCVPPVVWCSSSPGSVRTSKKTQVPSMAFIEVCISTSSESFVAGGRDDHSRHRRTKLSRVEGQNGTAFRTTLPLAQAA